MLHPEDLAHANAHVLTRHDALWVLEAHAWDHDWRRDGTTSMGDQCMARSEAKGDRCPKASVVEIRGTLGPIELCGGHFGVHRRGKRLTLMVAWEMS